MQWAGNGLLSIRKQSGCWCPDGGAGPRGPCVRTCSTGRMELERELVGDTEDTASGSHRVSGGPSQLSESRKGAAGLFSNIPAYRVSQVWAPTPDFSSEAHSLLKTTPVHPSSPTDKVQLVCIPSCLAIHNSTYDAPGTVGAQENHGKPWVSKLIMGGARLGGKSVPSNGTWDSCPSSPCVPSQLWCR